MLAALGAVGLVVGVMGPGEGSEPFEDATAELWAEPPREETIYDHPTRARNGAIATTTIGAASLASLGVLLRLRQRDLAIEASGTVTRDRERCREGGSCLFPAGRGHIVRSAFMGVPFAPVAVTVAMGVVSGHLWGIARPSTDRASASVVVGSVLLAASAATWGIARYMRPPKSCESTDCHTRWFDGAAMTYGIGTAGLAIGSGLLAYAVSSRRAARVRAYVHATPQKAAVSFQTNF